MNTNPSEEVTEEQRQAVREKYGSSAPAGAATNSSLKALKTMAYIGIIVGVVLAFISGFAGAFGMMFVISSFLFSLGFIAMFSYLIANAVITGLKQ